MAQREVDDDRAIGEGVVIERIGDPLERDIRLGALVQDESVGDRLVNVGEWRQWLVVHNHGLGRVDGLSSGFGEHDRNGLADETDALVGEHVADHRLVHHGQARRQRPDLLVDFGPGKDGSDAGQVSGVAEVDGADQRVRFDRTDKDRVRAFASSGTRRPSMKVPCPFRRGGSSRRFATS